MPVTKAMVWIATVYVLAAPGGHAQQSSAIPEPSPRITTVQAPTRDVPPQVRRVPLGTGVISGVVTAGDTARPVARARVLLSRVGSSTQGPSGGPVVGDTSRVSVRIVDGVEVTSTVQAAGLVSDFSRPAVTDEQGRFLFDALPAGQYQLSVTRSPYLQTSFGQTRPGGIGRTLVLADGQRMTASLSMPRTSVLAGVIQDPLGSPLVGVQVRAMRSSMVGGVRRLSNTAGAMTDDRGAFRLFGLQPGEYVVAVIPTLGSAVGEEASLQRAVNDQLLYETAIAAARQATDAGQPTPTSIAIPLQPSGAVHGFAPSYYPGTSAVAGATRIVLAPGAERVDLDFRIEPVRASHINGVVTGLPGPHVATQVTLQATGDDAALTVPLPSTRTGPDGVFTLANVPPGAYVIVADTVPGMRVVAPGTMPQASRLEPHERLWARVPVVVDGGTVPPMVVNLHPGRTISGTVVFDARVARASRAPITVSLQPASGVVAVGLLGPPPQATADEGGNFALPAVPAGRFTLRATGGVVKSAVVNGEDVLDFPLDFDGQRDLTGVVITMTDRLGELSGVLTGADGAGVDYRVVVAPVDRRYWTPGSRRIMVARPDTAGRYAFRGLPAGQYLLATVTDLDDGAQFDPAFLDALVGSALPVTIADAGTHVQHIRVAR